jgi:catechol 2,3-dioxygenase-like lactoylglutathione lyase family enzyme
MGENRMFSHVMVGTDDIARSKKFYDAVFAALGATEGFIDPKGRLIYEHNGGRFAVSKPINGKPACYANGGTIGFLASDPKQAEAWHKAGVANGGTSIEDPPGERSGTAGKIYLAYLRDPDGNKLCAVHRMT